MHKEASFLLHGAQNEPSFPSPASRPPPLLPFPFTGSEVDLAQTGFLFCQTDSRVSAGRRTPLRVV